MSDKLLIAPLEALTDPRLSDPERRVLLALFSFRNKVSDTVWPGIKSLAERSNIKDHTRVSKLTTSLAEKGWLTKKKKSFTGGNEYTLIVPEQESNLDSHTKLDTDTNSNLDSNANTNLDSDANLYIEQQREQQKEEVKKAPPKPKNNNPSLPKDINPKAWREWMAVRKKNGATDSEYAHSLLFNRLDECVAAGYSRNEVINLAVERGWKSINPEWVANALPKKPAKQVEPGWGGKRI